MADYFTITRDLAAPRELVFDAITKPEHFAVWFGTAEVEVPRDSLSMDVRPGGEFRAVMVLPDGNRINWAGEYVEVDPPARLTMTLTDNPGEYAGLPVLFDLEEIAGGHAPDDQPGPRRLRRRAGRGDDRGLQRVRRRDRARAGAHAERLIKDVFAPLVNPALGLREI